MEIMKELLDTLKEMSALKVRTEDVARRLDTIQSTMNDVLQRVTKLEGRMDEMRSSLKAEIVSDVKVQVAQTQQLLDLAQAGRLLLPGYNTPHHLPSHQGKKDETVAL